MKVYRQGDVGIVINAKINSENLVEKTDKIVAHGEVTGHAHRLSNKNVQLFVDEAFEKAFDAAREMQIKAFSPVELKHEEHEGIVLPIGDHKVTIQREFSWAERMARKVED